jgi:hypothetical protein
MVDKAKPVYLEIAGNKLIYFDSMIRKLKKFIKAILLIVKHPSLLNNIVNNVDVHKEAVIKKYNLPSGLRTVQLQQMFPAFNITVNPYASLDGGSTVLDIALLIACAKSKNDCQYLEIGTWRGESVANVATVADHCFTLNLSDATMEEMGLHNNYIASHRVFSKQLQNVTHLFGNSKSFDFEKLKQKFDLIFIDGDHHYEQVKEDTEKMFKLLRNDDAIIVWHDYGNNPADVRWDVLHGILDGTPHAMQSNLYHVSNTLCAIYYSKPIEASYPAPFELPKHHFIIDVHASDSA